MSANRRIQTAVAFLCALPLLAAEVTTGDRFQVSLSAKGTVTGVVSENSRFTPKAAPRAMFFVRDRGTEAWTPIVARVSDPTFERSPR